MSDAVGRPSDAHRPRQSPTIVYTRVVAMLLLVAGLARAAQILGIFTPQGLSFDELTPAMRAGAATLLLVDLMTAVGLWIGAVWGPVMWALALAIEVAMYTIFADIFGHYPLRVLVHLSLFAGFLALSFVEWRRTLE